MNGLSLMTRTGGIALLLLALGSSSAVSASPPNWLAVGYATTTPDGNGNDVDEMIGLSTHVGLFCGTGLHRLNPTDLTFAGHATWTALDGSKLYLEYTGQLFQSDDPYYPYGFTAEIHPVGGTRRLAGARGSAVMTGGLTGVPGEFYFVIEGNISFRKR